MADTRLSIAVVAELADFKKKMSELPGVGEKEARDMVAGIRRQLRAAEGAAASSAGKVAKSWEQGFKTAEESAKKALEQIGGRFGSLGSAAVDLGKSFSGLGLAAGLGAGLAGQLALTGVAMYGLAQGAVSLAGSAQDAAERLRELGESIDPTNALQLREYEIATGELSVALDKLWVSVGAPIAGELAVIAAATADNVGTAWEYIKAINAWGVAVEQLIPGVSLLRHLESDVYHALTDSTRALVAEKAAALDLTEAYLALGIVADDAEVDAQIATARRKEEADALKAAAKAERERTEAAKKHAEEVKHQTDRTAELLYWIDERDRKEKAAKDAVKQESYWTVQEVQMRAVVAQTQALQPQLDALETKFEAMTDAAEERADKFAAAWERVKDELRDLALQVVQGITDAVTDAAAEQLRVEEATIATLQGYREKFTDRIQELESRKSQYVTQRADGETQAEYEIREAQNARIRAEIDTEINKAKASKELNEQNIKNAREAALESWKANQRAQAASIAVNAAAAALITMTTVPFPASLALAGLAAAAATAAAVPILTATPPEFPMGRSPSPDHPVTVSIQRREAILNRRATAALGDDQIDALNRGLPGGAPAVHVHLGRRVIAEAIRSTQARPADPRAGKRRRRGR